mgnify:CR=1 FL=1
MILRGNDPNLTKDYLSQWIIDNPDERYDLSGQVFENRDFSGWRMSKVLLNNSKFISCNFSNADLSEISAINSEFIDTNFTKAALYRANLSRSLVTNSNFENSWCGTNSVHNRDFERFEYTFPQFIDSTHYRVHFTTEPADSFYWNDTWMTHESTIEYAMTVLEQAEFTYSVFEDDGWEMPPEDCDDSILDMSNPNHCINYGGNNLYDIYIA